MGLKDFIKHVYNYFDVTKTETPHELNLPLVHVGFDGYIPVYNEQGVLQSYINRSRTTSVSMATGVADVGIAFQHPQATISTISEAKPPQMDSVFYVKSPSGEYIPVPKPAPTIPVDPVAKLNPSLPSKPSTVVNGDPTRSLPPASNPKPLEIKGQKLGVHATRWDGWPDGTFEADFTWPEFHETLDLRCHWAINVGGGDRRGNEHAQTWEQGKKLTRRCLGIISCENPECQVIIRPNVKAASLDAQLRSHCHCGAVLTHEGCDVRSYIWKWSGGVHFLHAGFHGHRRPTHLLSIFPKERRRFEDLVKSNPQAGPLQLVVGVQGIDGPGESVADISPVFLNQHRVGKERLKVKQGEVRDGDALISAFADFDKKCPGFVIHSVFGAETVISVQSDFMRSQLVKNSELDGQVNGMASDGAHGWWKARDSILIVSSTYCSLLLCWVPGVLSYSNGSSALHFMYHFIAVLQSIAREAESRSIEVVDELFAGIMDFSQAERLGFIKAFIQFWITRPGNLRLVPELERAAEKLLKGCLEHFRAGITRLCRIGGVIPPDLVEDFKQRALGLVYCKDSKTFRENCALLAQDFPKIRDWIEWWARPSHASMIFESERVMNIHLWDSMPNTNNPEESMHWKLYSMATRDHAFLNGMYSLHGIACHFERLYEAQLKGIPIRYGQAEPWKAKAEQYGYTKPSRHRGEKLKSNDGRPPDTAKELLGPPPKKRKGNKKNPPATVQLREGIPSFPWKSNSCWLDSSLQALHLVFERLFDDFSVLMALLPSNSHLKTVFETYTTRRQLSAEDPMLYKSLGNIRDDLRTHLKKWHIVKNVTSFDSLSTWFHEIVGKEKLKQTPYLPISAFESLHLNFSKCSGMEAIGGPHVQISHTALRQRYIQLGEHEHKLYKGSVTHFFASFSSIHKLPTSASTCWRVKEAEALCSGKRLDYFKLLVSIPLMLTIELGHNRDVWDIPAVLLPDTDALAKKKGIIYDLISLVLINEGDTHFAVRFFRNGMVYTYDGMLADGYALRDIQGTFPTHMLGKNINPPTGFRVYEAYYALRGGSAAQDTFFKNRIEELNDLFDLRFGSNSLDVFPTISYDNDAFTLLQSKLRYWMSYQRETSKTAEYVTVGATDIDLKTIKFTPIPTKAKHGIDLSKDNPTNSESVPVITTRPQVASQSNRVPQTQEPKRSPQPELTQPISNPDSAWDLNCRCGELGNGNYGYDPDIWGRTVQCDECKSWSHLACQRDGKASNIAAKSPFLCDDCDHDILLERLGKRKPATRKSERKEMEERTGLGKPLAQRLWAGRGALARHGQYWYPVRLILRKESGWVVQWWRENEYMAPGIERGQISVVSHEDIRDSMWLDRTGRRSTRLGKWKRSDQTDDREDVLLNPSLFSYTKEDDEKLSPFKETLQHLLAGQYEKLEGEYIPAKIWFDRQPASRHLQFVPYSGPLSISERGRIMNWFEQNISKSKEIRDTWIGPMIPLAHAYTIFLLAGMTRDDLVRIRRETEKRKKIKEANGKTRMEIDELAPSPEQLAEEATWDFSQEDYLKGAWHRQQYVPYKHGLDVGKECLQRLEEEMFENSFRAGVAGNEQWGLDVGPNQPGFHPYASLPSYMTDGKRVGDEFDDELALGSNYKEDPEPLQNIQAVSKNKPKPRPVSKKRKRTDSEAT